VDHLSIYWWLLGVAMQERLLKIKNRKNTFHSECGFTILELIFVILIFAILSTIALANFRVFSARISFENLTQDIALRIVQAQKDAMMGAVNSNFISRDLKPSYGVYFTTSTSTTIDVSNNQFVYFTDMPGTGTSSTATVGDKVYIPPAGTFPCTSNPECISSTTINTGEYIDNICYKPVSSGAVCSAPSFLASVSIVFTRPLPDASIMISSPVGSTPFPATAACIEIASPQDTSSKRSIKVNSFGQLSTFNSAASPSLCS